jgi:nucleotide-binding universal stress UspA family protein
MTYAREFSAELMALYVRESTSPLLPLVGVERYHLKTEGAEFVDEIGRLGREIGVSVETRVDTGRRPENVILAVAEREKIDLLVMGVLFRSSEERLFFGPKVREILRRAECAVALIVPPQQPNHQV